MSNSAFHQPTWRGRCAVVLMMVIVGAWMIISFDRYKLINDACQYESTARNIRDSGLVSTSCLFYGEQIQFGAIPAPQTVFPPAFPALMAVVSAATGMELHIAAFALNLTCFLLSAVVIYELCLCLGSRPIGGLVSAACWLSLGIAWHSTWWGLSEPPFMLLTLLSVRLLSVRKLPFALLAGLCASAAICVRYAGLFLVVAGALNYAILLLFHRQRRLIAEAILFGIPPAITAWFLLGRNSDLVGTIQGGNEYDLGDSLKQVVIRFLSSTTELIGFSRSYLLSGRNAEYVLFVAVVLGVCLTSRFLADRERRRQTSMFFKHPVRLLTIVFPPTYVTAVVLLEYSKGSGLSDRLLLPVVPFVLALYAALISQVRHPPASCVFVRFACVVLVLSFAFGQFNAHRSLAVSSPVGPILKDVLLTELANGETLGEFLRERVTLEQPLLTSQPQLMHGLLKLPIVGLATGRYNTGGPWRYQRVEEDVIDRFGVKYVLWTKGPKLIDKHTPKFFMDLDRGPIPSRMSCVFESDQFELYEVVEPAIASSR